MVKQGLLIQLANMKEFFDRSTRVLTEEDSGFTPQEGVFTVANQVAHAAHTIDWFMKGAFAPEGFDMDFERIADCRRLDPVRLVRTGRTRH